MTDEDDLTLAGPRDHLGAGPVRTDVGERILCLNPTFVSAGTTTRTGRSLFAVRGVGVSRRSTTTRLLNGFTTSTTFELWHPASDTAPSAALKSTTLLPVNTARDRRRRQAARTCCHTDTHRRWTPIRRAADM